MNMHFSPAAKRDCLYWWWFTTIVILVLAGTPPLAAHVGAPPLSLQQAVLPVAIVQQVAVQPTDVLKELAIDAQASKPLPLRFAVPQPIVLDPTNSGTWEQMPDGRLWRVRIVSTNATDLNFGFTQFWLPEGATLHLISEADNSFQGPYTAADNTPAGQLWTPVVPGEAAIIKLFVPTSTKEEPRLVLTQVGTGYRDMFHRQKDLSFPKAESCEIDVVCPQGAAWTNEIRSVARIQISGTELCSGTLIMDAAGDFRAFFLTANHCGITPGNAATVVVYWNYQSPTCGLHGLGASATNNQTGTTFRAAKADVDFCLIELNQLPPRNYKVYYAGWDRSGTAPAGGVGIHHPNGDGKCISFSSNPLTTVNSCIGTGGSSTHWQVTWSSAVTEPGSSGSGIWDPATRKLVGTLSGGGSDCTSPSSPDCYGKFSVAWASGTSSTNRLRDWLNPLNTGVTSVAGSDPNPVAIVTAAGSSLVTEGCTPTNGVVDPGEIVTVNFSLQDIGTGPTTNLVATLQATNGVATPSGPQAYGALVAGGAAVARPFTFIAAGGCGGAILPTLQLQDGTRNLGTVSFSLTLGMPVVSFSQNFDGVTAPALPSAWSSSPAGIWKTTTAQRDSLLNSAFAPNAASVTDYQLTSPQIPISSASAQLSFRHYYLTESGYDGGVLEISINGGAFADIVMANGVFVSGPYNGTIASAYGNPLAGRSAWTGDSGGFLTTTVTLPAAAAGGNIQLRWRLGNDSSVSKTGWYIDTISVSGGYNCCSGTPPLLTTQPQSQVVNPGQNAVFSAAASGSAPLSYVWRFNGTKLAVPTTPTLTRTNVQLADAGNYDVVVTNLSGSATSLVASLTVITPPTNIQTVLSGSVLQLAWPYDHIGWQLQMQTNAPGAGLGTNWVIVPGSSTTNRMWFELDTTRGSVFFRQVYP
ncbi:MAG: immunoglobulin domain-containing protein [Verrucomicrobia bacterium]|nr:immunoglobulin domain-containing protein [Verrucomicrobiota bacterium]